MTAAATPGTPAASVPYGTPAEPRVAVRGEARLEVDPEIARLGVSVSARGTDRRGALEDLTQRNGRVLELVRGYGEAVERLETGAFTVAPELSERGRRERVRAYHGRVRVTVVVADFTVLGELATRLADLELTRVDGPWWALRPDSPAHREARQQAVREAVSRAREYAGALGSELVALVELADLGAEGPGPSGPLPPPGGMRAAAYAGAADSAPALDLEPQQQEVFAEVNARFTVRPPAL